MLKQLYRRLMTLVPVTAAALCMGVPALALENPPTGDGSSMMMPLMIGLLAVSAVLIVVFVVLSARKKK